MSDDDDEILQDFLIEAGEILEQLSEQLVDLERSPDDTDLLNSIFRGFHTVKGGAGFLQFDAMVDICHVAENVFDTLRKGECSVTPELMDTVLTTVDVVNTMFDQIRAGEDLSPAEPALIETLAVFATGATPEPAPTAAPAAESTPEVSVDPFEAAEPQAAEPQTAEPQTSADDEMITDAEFEALLDSLADEKKEPESEDPFADDPFADSTPEASASDEITEEEFQGLLDKFGATSGVEATKSPDSDPVAMEEPESVVVPEAPPVEAVAQAPASPTPSAEEIEVVQPAIPKVEAPVAKPAAKPVSPEATAGDADKAETKAAPKAKPAPRETTEATVRVDTKRLDDIMNMVGELVLVRNRLVRLGLNSTDEEMGKAVSNLDVVTADLQTSVMKTRMQPIKKVFGRFPRVVRDLARSLEKEINLELVGEETDLDKNLVEALADPLVHLVRNSVDHGVESPEEREAAGKNRAGTIVLSAEQEGDHILLVIQDDGKGMDPNVIREIAVSKGAIDRDAADRLNDSECFNLIFAPGFSTKEEISDVSGRGVGMDVVKTKITQLNGSVDVESTLGEGTRIVIKVPLTLAIMPTLMVMLQDQTFALPLVSVNEIFHLDLSDTNVVDGQEVIIVRNKAIPLYYLKNWLVHGVVGQPANDATDCHVVIVSAGNQRVGFVVDQLIGQEEVVIKPLGKMLHGTAGMAGATITGDGTIALILDVPGMLKRYG